MTTTVLRVRSLLVLVFLFALVVAPNAHQAVPSQAAQVQPPAKDAVAGVRNFTKADATVACGGALTLEAYEALRQAGYKSVVNVRLASESGVNIEEAKKAAESAGLVYIHLPFNNAAPDTAVLDEFLKAVVKPENLPMMLHCGSGTRVSMFWAVKRVMIDGWTTEKAMGELPDLSKNLPQTLRTFMLDYLKAHGKNRP
jgi:uncharacterized protein (TIGR01244 family)